VCAGVDGAFALEDAYVAGRLVARLPGRRSDAARAAERLAGAYATPYEALAQSAGAARLRDVGLEGDVAFCARESVLDVVPRVTEVDEGVAVVAG
jgi:2-phosphosulfolactate phosphatase